MKTERLTLYLAGLCIKRVDGDDAFSHTPDLVWRSQAAPAVPVDGPGDAPFVTARAGKDDEPAGSVFSFGYGGKVRCRFTVSADGRSVSSWAVPGVSDRDMVALFSEHILRTILVRRGLVSFHAASLSGPHGTILIMGDKGRGKSTLSWALQQRGWACVADDLTRVAHVEGCWRAFAGLRDTKLLAGSLRALGLQDESLPPRWDDDFGAGEDKRLFAPLSAAPSDPDALRVAAMLVLEPRLADLAQPTFRVTPLPEAVKGILDHSTVDFLAPDAPPSAGMQRDIGALVQSVPVLKGALPDRIDALPASAAALEKAIAALLRGTAA